MNKITSKQTAQWGGGNTRQKPSPLVEALQLYRTNQMLPIYIINQHKGMVAINYLGRINSRVLLNGKLSSFSRRVVQFQSVSLVGVSSWYV
jgi:hypothetical protein